MCGVLEIGSLVPSLVYIMILYYIKILSGEKIYLVYLVDRDNGYFWVFWIKERFFRV